MITDLDLKGNELLIYAIIYGFSQNSESKFSGGLTYLSEWTNSTKQGILKALKNLQDKGLIEKNDIVVNKVKYCEYKVIEPDRVLNKVEGGIKQSLMGCLTKFNGGVKLSLPNSINNNIENNINKYNVLFEEFWNLYPRKEQKKKTKEKFLKLLEKNDYELIKKGLLNYIEYIKSNKTETKYIKHPTTWLNGECWNDEYNINLEKTSQDVKSLLDTYFGG